MNKRLIIRLLGHVFRYEAVFMGISAVVSILMKESPAPFFVAIILLATLSVLLANVKYDDDKFKAKDGLISVALSWICISLAGALPFYFSGYFESFGDCIFESVSGFTGMGASILRDIESLPKGILFWRSFTHWVGGMGFLAFMLAVMPSLRASSINLLKGESSGPSVNRIVPKVKETAKIMYCIYILMTVVEIILLLFAGLGIYDSTTIAFSTAGTGGFSVKNLSIAGYDNFAVEMIVSTFMLLFGVSFTLYFHIARKDFKSFFKDEELRLFVSIVIITTILVTLDIKSMYGGFFKALRYSFFQISSIFTSTAFITTDFNLWPTFSKGILITLMLIGCCGGSTAGGIKVVRILLLFKALKLEISRFIHPRAVQIVKLNGKKVEDDTLYKVFVFLFAYCVVFVTGTILFSLEGLDLLTTSTTVISALGNNGPGLGSTGPMENYASLSLFSKMVLSICMLFGRLEFFPMFVILSPQTWKSN